MDYHIHNGLDMPQISVTDLLNIQNYINIRKVVLTPTQITKLKTNNSPSLTLIPAAGKNTVIIVESIQARLNYNTVAYTGSNNLEFRYTGTSGAKVTADMSSTFLNSAAIAYDSVAGVTTELTPVANSPIIVCVPTADPATGNSTLTLVIKYRIVSF